MKASNDYPAGPVDYSRQLAVSKSSSAVANVIIGVCHLLSFAPLVVIIVLQDVHLKLAIVLNTALCICLAVGNFCFHRMSVIQAYPKLLDTFLLAFYGSLIPVAYTQTAWLLQWVNVLHHGTVAGFMWLSILMPCWDNFVLEGFRDCLPEPQCSLHSTHAAALHAAQGWAVALTVMALAALGPVLSNSVHTAGAVYIVCDYVLGLAPLATAALLHIYYRRRCVRAAEQSVHGLDSESGGSGTARAVVVPAVPAATVLCTHESDSGSSSSSSSGTNNIRDVELGDRDAERGRSDRFANITDLLTKKWRKP